MIDTSVTFVVNVASLIPIVVMLYWRLNRD